MGFLISEVKEIFKDSCAASEHDIEAKSNEILDDIMAFRFEDRLSMTSSDEMILVILLALS